MKRITLTLILSVTFLALVKAPREGDCLILPRIKPIYSFGVEDPLLRAFMYVESKFKDDVVNPVTGARGVLQILPIMIREVNRIQKDVTYTWDDAFSIEKSIEIWYKIQHHHNPNYDIGKACRVWFGKGVQYDGLTWETYQCNIVKNGGNTTLI